MYIDCAIIGYGEFTQSVTIPCLEATKRFRIKYILVRSAERATAMNADNSVPGCCFVDSYERILADQTIKCVFIVTRHDQHRDQIMAALEAGKDVFTEKPMAMNVKDAMAIEKKVAETGRRLMVGFNRRFSPLSIRIKETLAKLPGPYLINYNWINKAWITEWPFDPIQGGGKLVSSGCHMIDLILFLLGETPSQISASLSTLCRKGIQTHDTAIVGLRFADGTRVNICTSEIGSNGFPQEKMEIFSAGGAMLMNDFKELRFFNLPNQDIVSDKQEKGLFEEMLAWAGCLDGKSPALPCDVYAGVNAARCVEACLKSAASGNTIEMDKVKLEAVNEH